MKLHNNHHYTQGGKNIGLNAELGITTETVTFEHPLDSERVIHFMHDFSHELKLLRNHLLDFVTILPCRTKVSKRDLRDLQKACESEITCGFILEDILLDCVSSDRQNYKYMIRLLSDLTSANIYRFFNQNQAKCAFAHFIGLIATVYKIMSSRIIWNKENDCWKDALSVNLEKQIAKLNEFIQYVENTEFGPNPNRFQNGMISTIRCTISLQKLLASKYNVSVND